MAANIWAVRSDDGWAVRREGESTPLGSYPTQRQAIDAGRELARQDGVELIWQGEDGQIQGRDSFGNDPRGNG